MGATRRVPAIWMAVIVAIVICASFIFSSRASGLTTDVTVDIPAGIIRVEGKTSPNAQVKIYINDNDTPTASVTSDASGAFNEELPQYAIGLVNVSIQAVDTDGEESALITKQVAVIAHQTSTLTVILPPTISVEPPSAIFQTGTLNFSGQTVPNALVTVAIEPSTLLTATADSSGRYAIPLLVRSLKSVGIYIYSVKVAAGSEVSDYAVAGTFTITPPIKPPVPPLDRPFEGLFDRATNAAVPAPEITYPADDELTTTEPIVIQGTAEPGVVVTLYDGESIIGAVVAGEDGMWQFYLSPYKLSHTIYAQACEEEKCSQNSRSVIIKRPETSGLPVCQPGITLNSYQLVATVGNPVEISGTLPEGTTRTVLVAWDDSTEARFDVASNDRLKATHTYGEAGTYSGFVLASTGSPCPAVAYFAVQVSSPVRPLPILLLIGATIATLIIIKQATSYIIMKRESR